MSNKIITDEERVALNSMSTYWKEVRSREDVTPLMDEVQQVYRLLGTRILDIIEEYLKLTKEDEKSQNPEGLKTGSSLEEK